MLHCVHSAALPLKPTLTFFYSLFDGDNQAMLTVCPVTFQHKRKSLISRQFKILLKEASFNQMK